MTDSPQAAGVSPPSFCPACAAVLVGAAAGSCPRCGLDLAGIRADELRYINAELTGLARRHGLLLARRTQILAELSSERATALAGAPGGPGGPGAAGPMGRRRDSSGRAMAHLLLAAGGIMLGLAVVAFTVASWARLGPAGRVAILLAATAVVLAAPVPLARRQLRATAESVAAVGLVLTLADAYLVYRLIAPVPGGGSGYAAMASAVMALTWLAYGRLTRLAGPVLGAIMIAQFPLVLAAIATSTRPEPAALALLGTSVGDSVLVIGWAGIMRRLRGAVGRDAGAVGREAGAVGRGAGAVGRDAEAAGRGAGVVGREAGGVGRGAGGVGRGAGGVGREAGGVGWEAEGAGQEFGDDAAWPGVAAGRVLTMVVSGLTGMAGFLIGLAAWVHSSAWPQAGPGWSMATWISGVIAAAAVATALAVRAIWSRWVPWGIAVAGGLVSVAAGIAVASALPRSWSAVAFGGASAVVIAVVALITRNRLLAAVPVAFGAAAILGLAEPASLISAASGGMTMPWLPMTFVVITAVAAAAAVTTTVWRGRLSGYGALLAAAPLVIAAAITSRSSGPFLAVGPGQHLTGPAMLAVLAFVSVALTVAVTWRSAALASAALGSWALTVAVSLADRSQALATLGLAVVAATVCAWRARQSPVRASAAFGAVLGLGALGQVVAEATGLHPWITVLAVLGIAALAQVTAWWLSRPVLPQRHPQLHRPGPLQTPVAQSPQAQAPVAPSPQAQAPVAQSPQAQAPVAQSPQAQAPVAQAPVAQAPVAQVPQAQSPQAQSPQAQSPTPESEPVSVGAGAADWRLVAVGVEAAGWLLTAIAVAAAAWIGIADESAPILLTAAVLCLTTSARPGRQHALWPGLVLGGAALLTWLVGPATPAPEPWTLPAAALVLCFGWLAQRRSPTLASWSAFGPGLAIALVPSLAAAWIGHGALRPLLLGLAAAAIAVAGARARLQAPVVLGALVAVLDGGRQIAPAVARLIGTLPNWVPVAVIGAALIWAGGTYEARLRDLRKVSRAVGGMH